MQNTTGVVKITNANLERPAVDAGKRTVLRASHKNILEGSRQVHRAEIEAVANPSGVSILQRKKEIRALKDVTNKLESSPINFKLVWNGLRMGASLSGKDSTYVVQNESPVV